MAPTSLPVRHGWRARFVALATIAALACGSGPAAAQSVVHGQASFSQSGAVHTITNTPGTIIQWPGFSIAPGATTRFVQPHAQSAVLNRVMGQDPSLILGTLESNGRVLLVNPNGVLFGAGSRVDVNGLVASSLALSNADFLAGRMNFSAGEVAGRVANAGRIHTPGGGHVMLIAPNVENRGVIHAPGGQVVLAAGRSVQLADSANPALHVVVSAPQDQALNLGQVLAESGRIGVYGALVNQRGIVNADSATVGAQGQIVFKASGDLLLEAGSRTSARGVGTGGTVHLLGDRVGLTGDAAVDASGQAGGGTVLVGGDVGGRNPAIAQASQVVIGAGARINADAGTAGQGGTVVAWSTGTTRMLGEISARGGEQSGDGGFVETSGRTLDMRGRVDTRAPNGRRGTLLLDPTNIFIATNQANATAAGIVGNDLSASGDSFTAFGPVSDSLLTVDALQAAVNNGMVVVSTANANPGAMGAGIIRVVDAVTWNSDGILSLQATGGIQVNAPITAANGRLELHTTGGNITQGSPIRVLALAARADAGTVILNNSFNQVQSVAGYAGAGGGFNFFNSGAAPLTIGSVGPEAGITTVGSGAINVSTGGNLVVQSPVTSAAGNIVLAPVGTFENQSSLSSISGRITAKGVLLRPSLADCVAQPATAGCTAVLPTLAACQADATIAGCSAVLPPPPPVVVAPPEPPPPPTVAACTAAPATPGCQAVLPSLNACVAAPATPGCAVVLPLLSACIRNPAEAGCSVVLPSVAQCTVNPSLPGCSVVLPGIAQCTATPTLNGCSVVLPSLALCTSSPTTAGCSAVLPGLTQCISNPATAGCGAVLPTLTQCTANPNMTGCRVVLPSLSRCIASSTLQGCTAVLPSLSQCVFNPAAAGCAVVLPGLSSCVISPATPGCSVVLPTIGQCTASPTLSGCTVVLPPINVCLANPVAAGCAVVVPPAQSGAPPIISAVNTTVNLVQNTAPGAGTVVPSSSGGGATAQPMGTSNDVRKKTYCN